MKESIEASFELHAQWMIFLVNYFMGARVKEMCSLSIKSVDLILDLIKFRVKDTVKRKNTTKVIPLFRYVRKELIKYLKIREKMIAKYGNCGSLFFKLSRGHLTKLTESDINGFYRDLALLLLIPLFSSHRIRYQTQSDMTRVESSFEDTNCLLSHYPMWDAMFSEFADKSYTDFKIAYCKKAEELLAELL